MSEDLNIPPDEVPKEKRPDNHLAKNEKSDDEYSPSGKVNSISGVNNKMEDLEKAIANQDNKNMEVHHHAHHDHGSVSHQKKSWKSYFWEFMMLFLAVFCGFLAEYQLEHVIEHNREKQFVRTFIEDLETDTATISRVLAFRQTKMEKMDSLMLLLSSQLIRGYENDLYFFGRTLIRTMWFRSNDGTITQLKNSGSLRLIRNKLAADSMISYQKLVETINQNQEDDRIERYNTHPLLAHIFNPFVFDKMVSKDGVNRPDNNPPLRSYDPNLQQDLAFYVHQIKGSNFIIEGRLKLLNDKAINTITFLKKEYHLE